MSEEKYKQIIDAAYDNYTQTKIIKNGDGVETHITPIGHYGRVTQEEFINKIKTDTEFSEKWGLRIEERELSDAERVKLLEEIHPLYYMEQQLGGDNILTRNNIPTKLITITYNGETIESYE